MTPTTPPVNLDSTTLAAAEYDDRQGHLQLDFRDGSHYTHFGVAPELYHNLLRAASQGLFFNRYIRGRFPYAKLVAKN